MQLGSIEAGGTKFVCAVGDENYHTQSRQVIPTTTPRETLAAVNAYFAQFPALKAMGIASFGPIEIRRHSPKYGYITNTPKPGWSNTDFVGAIRQQFKGPIAWTTDVNGSAYGEYVLASLFNEKKSPRWFTTPWAPGSAPASWKMASFSAPWATPKWATSMSSVTRTT